MTKRVGKPAKEPTKPSCLANWANKPMVDWPGAFLVLLTLDNNVSAGWETMAAAKPAVKPESKLTVSYTHLDVYKRQTLLR